MRGLAKLVFLLISTFSVCALGRGRGSEPTFEDCIATPVESYCELKPYARVSVAGQIHKLELQSLLEKVYQELKGVGFRYIGHDADLFHGHLLSSGEEHVILYHTQEMAAYYDRRDPNHRYGYLNRKTRNWLQFLPSGEIKDATQFISWDGAFSEQYSFFRQAYTINSHMLDLARLFSVVSDVSSNQFSFFEIACEHMTVDNNVLQIAQSSEPICLVLR